MRFLEVGPIECCEFAVFAVLGAARIRIPVLTPAHCKPGVRSPS